MPRSPDPVCSRHRTVAAVVKVPRGEHAPRYLCHDCLRDERPALYVSLPMAPKDNAPPAEVTNPHRPATTHSERG